MKKKSVALLLPLLLLLASCFSDNYTCECATAKEQSIEDSDDYTQQHADECCESYGAGAGDTTCIAVK